jgi:dienelactone hydrolase
MMAVYGVALASVPEAHGKLARSAHPVAALFGGSDQGLPPEEAAAIAAALDQSPAPHDVHVYAGAPHSFFDEHFSEHAYACRDVWDTGTSSSSRPRPSRPLSRSRRGLRGLLGSWGAGGQPRGMQGREQQ